MPDTGGCVLGDLSPELVIKILHYCDYSAIFKFAATCKAYQKIVADTTSLQLHIELEANGLEIVKGSFKGEATYSIILEDLRRFRDAWLNLDVSEPITRSLGESETLLWELREGFYIKAFSRSRHYARADAIQFIPLDSESPDPPPLMFDFKFNEFTVDPEQGLIAMICRADDFDLGNTCDIHLCSSATGLAHPLAQYPKLTVAFDYPLPPFSSQFALEIMGHRLLTKAAHSGANNYELLIWDWRHGALLHRISSREGMCDFTFLDQRHLVVLSVTRSNPDRAILNKFALMIYAITWDASLQIAANTAHVRVEDISISEPILHLAFPRLRESVRIREKGLFLRSDPTPGRTIYANSAAFSCPRANTLSISLSSDGPWTSGEPRSYRIFVDGGYLLDLIRTNSGNVTSVVPWSAWGVNTRWFTAPEDPSYWICWMSGSRYVRPLSQPPYYCVFEFSSPTVGRFQGHSARSSPASSDVDTGVGALEMNNGFGDLGRLDNYLLDVLADTASGSDPPEPIIVTVGADNPSTINADNDHHFDEPITSRLPYRVVCRGNNQLDHEGWQINRDCIVGVFVSSIYPYPECTSK
ncbi:unnamed protein product [Rhizoctonia solani]|uniref:F-box domain-containing protein n=1 Tax=Rhizoctonia solani TaxID=456999 RepID=A0A8H3DLT1_9AGAM|nr:unnamed protein product [Rhizoctonia solani]